MARDRVPNASDNASDFLVCLGMTRCAGMIAAITLARGASLLTANIANVRQVPGLVNDDWLGA